MIPRPSTWLPASSGAVLRIALVALLCAGTLLIPRDSVASPDYFSQSMYWIGLPGRFTSQVTPEGNLSTGFYEYAFYTGLEMRPMTGMEFSTPADGRPLVRGTTTRDVFRYDMQYFSAPLALGIPFPPQAEVVTVRISNVGTQTKLARFWAGVLFPDRPHRVLKGAHGFFWGWRCEFRRNVITHDNKVIGVYPVGYAERLWYPGRTSTGRFAPNSAETSEQSPILLARYELRLDPGRDTTLSFIYPVEPAPDSYPVLIQALGAEGLRRRFDGVWDPLVAGMPSLRLGNEVVNRFMRQQLLVGLLQEGEVGGYRAPVANKARRLSTEMLDFIPYAQMWSRAGMTTWAGEVLGAARFIMQDRPELYSGRDGYAPAAGYLGMEAEFGAGRRVGLRSVSDDTLALRADTVAAFLQPARNASLLELSTAAWALHETSLYLDESGHPDAARARAAQSLALAEAARKRMETLPDSEALVGQVAAVRWLSRSGGLPAGWAAAHFGPGRIRRWNSLVAPGGDSVLMEPTSVAACAQDPGSLEATRSLLDLVAHCTLQGGVPAGFRPSRRDFGDALPSDGLTGSEVFCALLDRVAAETPDGWSLGRGLIPPAPRDTLEVGPLRGRRGDLTVRAHFGANTASWSWIASKGGAARIRVYAPAGTRLAAGPGTMSQDSTFTELEASAGAAEVRWRGALPAGTLDRAMADASAEGLTRKAESSSKAANPGTKATPRPAPTSAGHRRR